MKYIPLSILEEINEYEFDLKEINKAINQTNNKKNRQYLEDVRTDIEDRLNKLKLKIGKIA